MLESEIIEKERGFFFFLENASRIFLIIMQKGSLCAEELAYYYNAT